MKNLFKITEQVDNNFNTILLTKDFAEAINKFNELKKQDGYKETDITNWSFELSKLDVNEDWNGDLDEVFYYVDDEEAIESFTFYQEGTIDRNNFKGEGSLNYGYIAKWDSEVQELIYGMLYFQGNEVESYVKESELKNWYF